MIQERPFKRGIGAKRVKEVKGEEQREESWCRGEYDFGVKVNVRGVGIEVDNEYSHGENSGTETVCAGAETLTDEGTESKIKIWYRDHTNNKNLEVGLYAMTVKERR